MDLFDLLVAKKLNGGGGSSVTIEALSVTSNGTYTASEGYAYSPVSVNVSGIVPSGTLSISANGTYDVTAFASASVLVGGGGSDADEIIQGTLSGNYFNATVTEIYMNAFYGFSNLQSVEFPNCLTVGNQAFASCKNLTQASFPNATTFNQQAFQSCTKLENVYAPNLIWASRSSTFALCNALSQVSFPKLKNIGAYMFWYDSMITTLSFPEASYIGGSAFEGCKGLMSLYLMSTSMVNLANWSNVFSETPMRNSTYTGAFGSIYVPASLVSTYVADTKWSRYESLIVGV